MTTAINNSVAILGSTLVIGIKFPKIDGYYSFRDLKNSNSITAYYYIVNTVNKYEIKDFYSVLDETDTDYDNMFAFTVDTSNLSPGVLMVELVVNVPAHDKFPARTEIARCSTGVAIVK